MYKYRGKCNEKLKRHGKKASAHTHTHAPHSIQLETELNLPSKVLNYH